MRGLRERYLKGNYTGGPVLFGYDVVDKKDVINSVEGVVKEIFSLYAQDYTAAYIADEMRKRGIRTKKGKYLIRDIVLYNDKIIINYYFAEPLKKHTNSIASVIETEKQSREAASLSEIQSSYKGDNSPPEKPALPETRRQRNPLFPSGFYCLRAMVFFTCR